MDDKEIIDLYFKRDEEAIPETEKKYGAYCLSVAKNILGNTEDAKECLNDTLLVLWNEIPPKKPEVFLSFIGKITRNISLNLYRKNTAKKRGGIESDAVFDEMSEFVSDKEEIESAFERKELINEINIFLKKLPAEKRNIFILRYWGFESAAEIAKRFGKNETAVHNSLQRTREKLKKHLAERGFNL